MAKWPQGALPCLPLSGIHRPPCRGRHRYAGLKDAVLFPSGLIDHVAEAESKPHSLSEARATFSFWEKERALLSDDSPESVQHPYSMGCCSQHPWWNVRPLSLAALEWRASLLLGSFTMFLHTQQRRAWRELAKGNNTNIDMLIFLYIHIDINKAMQIYDNVEMKQYSNTSIHQYGNVAI